MKIKELQYKEFKIEVYYNDKTNYFSAKSEIVSSRNEFDEKLSNFDMGFTTPTEAIEDCKKRIDDWLSQSIKTYKELAERITKNLTWASHEECYMDEQVLIRILNLVSFNLNIK